MCIDYTALNAITLKNRYPLPNINDLLDRFAGAQVFNSLDLASGYHQIKIGKDEVPKTAFTTPFGHYELKVLSFGLTNAPATFQAVMNKTFGHLHKFCVVYLDDILIFSKTPEEHAEHLETVLQILRSFLGLANYFRRFVPAYSVKAAPMTKLTGKNTPWNWSSQCQDAFTGLKADLTNSPVLASPDITKHFEVNTDACGEGIGAVLIQEGQPVAYLSRKLQGAELNYTTTEQELLASITAMRT